MKLILDGKVIWCVGHKWQGDGSGGVAGVASVRALPHARHSHFQPSLGDPPLATGEPIGEAGGALMIIIES